MRSYPLPLPRQTKSQIQNRYSRVPDSSLLTCTSRRSNAARLSSPELPRAWFPSERRRVFPLPQITVTLCCPRRLANRERRARHHSRRLLPESRPAGSRSHHDTRRARIEPHAPCCRPVARLEVSTRFARTAVLAAAEAMQKCSSPHPCLQRLRLTDPPSPAKASVSPPSARSSTAPHPARDRSQAPAAVISARSRRRPLSKSPSTKVEASAASGVFSRFSHMTTDHLRGACRAGICKPRRDERLCGGPRDLGRSIQ